MGAHSFAVLGEPWYVGGMWHVSKGVKDQGVMGALTNLTAPIGAVPPSFAGNLLSQCPRSPIWVHGSSLASFGLELR